MMIKFKAVEQPPRLIYNITVVIDFLSLGDAGKTVLLR
jgi:hypothetical protein